MARVPILCVQLCLIVHLHCMPLLEESSRIPTSDEIAFLKRFGYLPNSPAGTEFAFDSYSLSEAVRLFQSYGGLTQTGIIDAQTEQLFKKPRCGNKDLFIYDDDTSRRKRYVISRGGGWKKRYLTYKFITKSSMLSSTLVDQYFAWALAAWAAHAGLTFTQVKEGTADINVGFYSGYHGCGYPFDGKGNGEQNELAHAFAPIAGGALHFDDDENWYEDDESSGMNVIAIKFLNTALHEIGHVLGLNHSSEPGAVMYPWSKAVTVLTDDDVQGIKALYHLSVMDGGFPIVICMWWQVPPPIGSSLLWNGNTYLFVGWVSELYSNSILAKYVRYGTVSPVPVSVTWPCQVTFPGWGVSPESHGKNKYGKTMRVFN